MRNRILILFLMLITILFSCSNPEKPKWSIILTKPTEQPVASNVKNNLLIIKGDSLQVSINNGFITVPKKSVFDYDSVYSGIYQIKNKSIKRQFSIQIDDIVYFTTFASVGMGYRGYLYAYDLKRRKFFTNSSSKENYVYAGGGIFFLNDNYIFCVQNTEHENAEDDFYTLIDIYGIKDSNFDHIRYISINGGITYDDTSIIGLYNKVIKYKKSF